MLINITKKSYAEWYQEHLGISPPMYILEKYEFMQEPAREATESDWVEFWESV